MFSGVCLCGAVRFEVAEIVGPFELCHCPRCRRSTGSAFAAMVGAKLEGFRITQGSESMRSIELPVLETPPGYRRSFCGLCGSLLPDPNPLWNWFEVPAGCLDDDPGVRPDKHINVERKAAWHDIVDGLPQYTKAQLRAHRAARDEGA